MNVQMPVSRRQIQTSLLVVAVTFLLVIAGPAQAAAPMGSFDSTWGAGGAAPLPDDSSWLRPQLIPSAGDRTIVVANLETGSTSAKVARLETDGLLDSAWDGDGIAEIQLPSPVTSIGALTDGSNGAWVYGTRVAGASTIGWITHLTGTGALDDGFGGIRDVELTELRTAVATPANLLLAGRWESSATVLAIDRDTGEPDLAWAGDGSATIADSPSGTAVGIGLDSVGRATVTWIPVDASGFLQRAEPYGWVRVGADGVVAPGSGRAPTSSATNVAHFATFTGASDIVLAAQHHITYGGRYLDQPRGLAGDIVRLEADGTAATTASLSGREEIQAISVTSDSRRVVMAGRAAYAIAADGTIDETWAVNGRATPEPGTGLPLAAGSAVAVVVAHDGHVRRLAMSGDRDTKRPRLRLEPGPCSMSGQKQHCRIVPRQSLVLRARAVDNSGVAWLRSYVPGDDGIRVSKLRGRYVLRAGQPCIHLSAVDAVGNASPWAVRCMRPVRSERALTRLRGWSISRSRWYVGGQAFMTRQPGSVLLVPEAHRAKGIKLLVTKCPRCGALTVTYSDRGPTTISLRTARVRHRVGVELYATPVSIKSTSRRLAIVDGFEPPTRMPTCADPYEVEWTSSPYSFPVCTSPDRL